MIKGEMNAFYPKYLDKNKEIINLGDTLYGEDGKAWKINMVVYATEETHPLGAWNVKDDGTEGEIYKALKPKWLTHQDPNKKIEVSETALKKWHDDLTRAIVELPVGSYPFKTLFTRVRDDIKQYIQDDYMNCN